MFCSPGWPSRAAAGQAQAHVIVVLEPNDASIARHQDGRADGHHQQEKPEERGQQQVGREDGAEPFGDAAFPVGQER